VRIDPLPKMVGSANSQYDVVSDGLADISFIVPGYTPARFDALALAELPFITDDPEVGAVATYRWYDKHVKALDLFKEVHVLSIFTTSAGTVLAKTPIKSIEDFKGRKVRSPLPITLPMLQAVGAVPVLKPGSEAFEMLSTGALDASLSGAEQAITFHLGEVTKQMLIVPGGIYNSVCMIGINKKVWNSLSEADRAAIERISGEALARRMGASFLKPIADAKAYMTSKGNAVDGGSVGLAERVPHFLVDADHADGIIDATRRWWARSRRASGKIATIKLRRAKHNDPAPHPRLRSSSVDSALQSEQLSLPLYRQAGAWSSRRLQRPVAVTNSAQG
jgi:hypothetical protein